MVKWRGSRRSKNVRDRRGERAVRGAGGGGILVMLLRFIFARFGLKGILFLVIAGAGLYAVGINPLNFLQSNVQPQVAQSQRADSNDEMVQFVAAILGETEDVWTQIFADRGQRYEPPILNIFSGSVNSACGFASAASGPFYCPADREVYLDLNFFEELSTRFGAPGDAAAAYVIAHEVGHHVQTITGISSQVRAAQQRGSKHEANEWQVRMELQADCFSGLWAKHANRDGDFLERGDIQEALHAAHQIGDDTLQRNAGRTITPESFTHGTSAQRMAWFERGFQSGDVDQCDTMNGQAL